MRAAFICRQCLSRLAQTSSPSQSLRSSPLTIQTRPVPQRRSIHTQSLQEQDSFPIWQQHQESNVTPQEEEMGGTRGLADSKLVPRGSVRKYFLGDQDLDRKRFKSTILAVEKERIHSLIDLISTKYNLPSPAAHVAAGQLRRLLRDHKRKDANILLDEFDLWKYEFGFLLRQYSNIRTGIISFSTPSWAVFSDKEVPSVTALKAAWMKLDADKRRPLWPRMVLSILGSDPTLLSSFVQATYDPSWSPGYVVEDLVRILFFRAKALKLSDPDPLVDLVFSLLESSPDGHLNLGGDIISTVVSMISLERTVDLFRLLTARGQVLNPKTKLHFASRFAKSPGHKVLGAEILCSMAEVKGFDINEPNAASVCTSLLNLTKGEDLPQGQAAPDELFKMLLEHGLRPNLLNISALIKNFCVRGYLDTAWTVFDLLLQYRIEPDEYVYSVLLHASKKAGDIDSIQRVMAGVHSQKKWNPVILNEFLDIMFKDNESQSERRRRQRKSKNAFRPMLQVYAKFFRLEPLQKLCSFPLNDYLIWRNQAPSDSSHIMKIAAALMPQPEMQLIDPDTITLTLLLSASIRKLPNGRNGPRALIRHYRHFNNLVEAGDPLAVSIVKNHGTLVYDIFLRSMLQHRQFLESGVDLVRNMIRLAEDEHRLFGNNNRHPRPSVYTWAVLINGFKNHRRPRIAVTMMNMMVKEGGIQPDIVTWNTLVKAFARENDARGAVRTMRYMEQAGFQPNKHTVEALGSMQLEARELAVTLMEASSTLPVAAEDVAVLEDNASTKQEKDLSHTEPSTTPSTQKPTESEEGAPPLTREQILLELHRLNVEGEELLSRDIEEYAEELPGAIASLHPLMTDHLKRLTGYTRLVDYKEDVEAFIRLVRQAEVPLSISTTQPITKPRPIREWLAEAWEEAEDARIKLRALKFPQRPVGIEKDVNNPLPLGIVSGKAQALHPRIATNQNVKDLSKNMSRDVMRKMWEEAS